MSMSTPPGWYPDPDAPGSQRWWDGSVWTEHRQPAGQPADTTAHGGFGPAQNGPAQNGPGYNAPTQNGPAHSGFGTVQGGFGPAQNGPAHSGFETTHTGFGALSHSGVPDPGGNRGKVIALTVAGVVLVAAIGIGAFALSGDDGEPEAAPSPTPTVSVPVTPTPSPSPTETGSSAPPEDPNRVTDQLNGITMPIIEGRERAQYVVDPRVLLTSGDPYDCPSGSGMCHYAMASSRTAPDPNERSAKKVAEADIKTAAEDAYDDDVLGSKPYDGITSHKQVKAGQIAVAGRSGYYVRWQVKTGAGPGGYVQSLAFPSSVGSESMVVVRIKVDGGKDAPPVGDIDKIVQGIRSVDDETGDGGVGNTVEPKE
ncbi:DUF2510 domain-containing protein [Streptomyces sp. NA04227]|uniref:DUF2510 domain-containing protein n=1 Tax=Streptomyces sp. NA04227 TaxID=2742136 RepID=UPI00158FCF5E|nr:DUF2510 domain-containing protein [Streptomyces sp. NA04227]QKW05606.1 DUF2510 domain-containing protein [Streptomyces sp. NA04227]